MSFILDSLNLDATNFCVSSLFSKVSLRVAEVKVFYFHCCILRINQLKIVLPIRSARQISLYSLVNSELRPSRTFTRTDSMVNRTSLSWFFALTKWSSDDRDVDCRIFVWPQSAALLMKCLLQTRDALLIGRFFGLFCESKLSKAVCSVMEGSDRIGKSPCRPARTARKNAYVYHCKIIPNNACDPFTV